MSGAITGYGEIADGIKAAAKPLADAKRAEHEQIGALATALIQRLVDNGLECNIHTAFGGTYAEARFYPYGFSTSVYAPVKVTANDLADLLDRSIDQIDHYDWAAEAQR